MHVLKALTKGATALGLVGGLAFSFAPPTDAERAALGDAPPRIALVQRRVAIVFRDIAPEQVQLQFAAQTGASPEEVAAALDMIIDGDMLRMPVLEPALPEGLLTEPQADPRDIRAGGALFVRPDQP